jgi:hypothetical protein
MADWSELTKLTHSEPLSVERVRLKNSGIAVEGAFDLPPLAQLAYEDQVFVAAFVKCHGSIKEMERLFGVSYPTIKSRLNRIGSVLSFVDVNVEQGNAELTPAEQGIAEAEALEKEVLDQLDKGEISVEDAILKIVERMKQC